MGNERPNDAPKQSGKKENQLKAMKSWRGYTHIRSRRHAIGIGHGVYGGLTVSICCFVSLVNVNSVEQAAAHQQW